MAVEQAARPARERDLLGWAALVLGGLVTLAFFAGRLGINAPGVGQQDLGLSLALALLVSVSIYLSIAMSLLDAALLLAAILRRRRRPILLWALAVSLLPVCYLALRD